MTKMPLALTARIRVLAKSVLTDPKSHDLAHRLMDAVVRARLKVGSTPPGVPTLKFRQRRS